MTVKERITLLVFITYVIVFCFGDIIARIVKTNYYKIKWRYENKKRQDEVA